MTLTALSPLQTIEVRAVKLAWREAGRGPVLVLVHGIGGSSASWQRQFSDFAATHRVVAWDAPGYGGSSSLAVTPTRVETYAESLVAWLEAIDVQRASFVGHSLGALFIAAASRLRPELLQRAVFLQPVTGNGRLAPDEREAVRQGRIREMVSLGSQAFAEQRGRNILSRNVAPDIAAHAIDVMAKVPEEGYLAAWDAMCEGDIFKDLDSIRCPTLVVCGSEDSVSPEATGREIASHVAGASFTLLPGVGHYASIEAPDALRDILTRFLESKPSA
jgi:pimeloyl-ACP methyl ester carboxylesterase